jgi:hypothetical protein
VSDLDVDALKEVALAALEAAGLPRSRVLLGIVGDTDDDGTDYEAHVGATENRDDAAMLTFTAKQLVEEAQQQGAALASAERCPICASQRYGMVRRPADEGPIRLRIFDVCMDCGHETGRP